MPCYYLNIQCVAISKMEIKKSPILQLQFINVNMFLYDMCDTVFTKINMGYSKKKHCSSSLG